MLGVGGIRVNRYCTQKLLSIVLKFNRDCTFTVSSIPYKNSYNQKVELSFIRHQSHNGNGTKEQIRGLR